MVMVCRGVVVVASVASVKQQLLLRLLLLPLVLVLVLVLAMVVVPVLLLVVAPQEAKVDKVVL